MAELILNEKAIASSRCKLMQGPYSPDPLFCKIFLTEDALIFLNDEISRKGELLFHIPIHQIKDFTFIKEKKQKKGILISLFDALVDGFANFLEGLGVIPQNENRNNADILGLSFVDEQGEKVDFILDMMKDGESGLIRKYKKLI
jgi:hypothetical protein